MLAILLLAVIAAATFSGLLRPEGWEPWRGQDGQATEAPQSGEAGATELSDDVTVGRQQAIASDPLDPPAGRPPASPSHPDENPHSIPAAQISRDYVSGVVFDQQVVLADAALPWRYWLDAALPGAVAEASVHQAVAAWDGVPGSRWATSFAGYRQAGTPIADGHSTIFMEADCDELTTANTYLFSDGGLGVDRYGVGATQILEADIGICPRVISDGQLQRAVRHEVGHVLGLGHMCAPGDDCWVSAMGEGPHECAIMFWQARSCQTELSAGERLAVATLYPTLRRLAGTTPGDTAARASFAVIADGSAPLAVVVAADEPAGVVAAAATMAGRGDGPMLLARPSSQRCLDGPAAAETSRSLARRGTLVLVGTWPASCDRLAYDWDIRLRQVPTGDPVAAALQMADLGGPTDGVVLTDVAAGSGQALVAASLATARDQPLVLTRDDRLGSATRQWLARARPGHATIVGRESARGADLAQQLVDEGVPTDRLDGDDAVGTGLMVAQALVDAGLTGVVLAPVSGGPESLAAVVVTAREGAAAVLSGPAVDSRVQQWLVTHAPTHGWAVGAEDVLPAATLAAYGAHVGG
ncbi:MAG TPA: hypothetical protein VMM13_14070 [Euzebya sp.]|nr:hypothetical protein [Euzebya sp.]